MTKKTPVFLNKYKTPKKRSYIMSHIRDKRTSIENTLALKLWHQGIHYRRNYKKLPGKPDITLTKYNIAVFCDGDYWHGYKFNKYKKNHWHRHRKYWIHKITYNMKRDKLQTRELQNMGWTVLRFWGHTIKKYPDYCVEIIKYYIRSKK